MRLPNGYNQTIGSICGTSENVDPLDASLRITGTLVVPSTTKMWYNFSADVGRDAWVRLWVDDHRLVDLWDGSNPHPSIPTTPGLLPNVTLASPYQAAIKVDLRPQGAYAAFRLFWSSDANRAPRLVPDSALVPSVSAEQMQRRSLQERVATGWNQWWRHSSLAQVSLPQQVGVDLGIRDETTGQEYRGGLLNPQLPSKKGPAVPVTFGHHTYNGSMSAMSVVPFPFLFLRSYNCRSPALSMCPTAQVGSVSHAPSASLNLTVSQVTVPGRPGTSGRDNLIVVTSNATSSAAAAAANLSLVIHPMSFWGCRANLSQKAGLGGAAHLLLDAGDLGIITASFSRNPLAPPPAGYAAAECKDPDQSPCLAFGITAVPLVMLLSGSGPQAYPFQHIPSPDSIYVTLHEVNVSAALSAVLMSQAAVVDEITETAPAGMTEAYDAMMTSIAWNVNFDPRVAVTVPVSRTFESSFDFVFPFSCLPSHFSSLIFFDWDMYFLSLMAGTAPAAASQDSFEIAVSNLIGVTQTRSAYGQVMNKRAAAGSSTSDSNDRTEPYVGSMVVHRMYVDSLGTPREATMTWVVRLLYPTLLGWNQWAWNGRRYNVGQPDGGLLVLGSDANTYPCENSVVPSPGGKYNHNCSNFGQTVLESGMDNSPMYYRSFDDQRASWDGTTGRLQLYDCQMSSLFVSKSQALQALAGPAGSADSVAIMLAQQSHQIAELINAVLWNPAREVYQQVDASPQPRAVSSPVSPTSFYTLLSGTASQAQASSLIRRHLTNVSEFCVDGGDGTAPPVCPFSLPSISRSGIFLGYDVSALPCTLTLT
eukprot:gene8041-1437_t